MITTKKQRHGNRASLVDEAMQQIREAIVSGRLHPRERLIAASFADELNMSRTPIREALQQLKLVGYIRTLPTGRMVVADRSKEELKQLYQLREALECKAIELACDKIKKDDIDKLDNLIKQMENATNQNEHRKFVKINKEFHSFIYSLTENKRLQYLIEEYRDQFMDVRLVLTFSQEDWQVINKGHKNIVNALRNRDCRKAKQEIRMHLLESLKKRITRL